MTSELAGLEPAILWQHFAALSAIPRPSFHEAGVREHLLATARARNWEAATDGAGNVVLRVPATAGREGAPIVVLQAHMDMVPIKAPGSPHNFETDPIRLRVAEHAGEPIVTAHDTTLGADNGLGLVAALAVATDDSVAHGPLEIFCTVNEESGMTGAHGMDGTLLRGRLLLNLDSEEDDALYVGCVGGASGLLTWEGETAPAAGNERTAEVRVLGLRGGHSGLEIHQPRGNAIQLLAKLLARIPAGLLRVCEITGGSRINAIPSEARAVLVASPEVLDLLRRHATTLVDEARVSLGPHASGLRVTVEPVDITAARALDGETSHAIATGLAGLPHGVLARDEQDPSVLVTSCNLALLRTTADGDRCRVETELSVRSLQRAALDGVLGHLERQAGLCSARFKGWHRYPGWEPRRDSALLATAGRVYESLFGAPPRIAVIHGGLECGIIGSKVPGIEMVSFGPRIEEAHTPEERVFVRSVAKFWRLLTGLLDELSRP
ncbi:MAG: beta-Ala-His dipeptidase [Candidatus Sumerlaeia bacterium]|nr:beta-Ala-His dipeptidase [Candidatus Sumerlaeia bacterium]